MQADFLDQHLFIPLIFSFNVIMFYSTDKMSEAAILDVVKKNFQDHLILGEEGGVIGNSSSDYLWCIDPLGISH